MKRFILLVCCIVGLSVLAVSLTYYLSPHSGNRALIPVTASFYPMAYFAQAIGTPHASVTTIIPAGSEPHDYEPTTQDILTITKSKLLILNGAGVESWGTKVQSELPPTTHVVFASKGIAVHVVSEDNKQVLDPHVWLDPLLATSEARSIADAYISADPAHAHEYEKNYTLLSHKLIELDHAYRDGLSHCSLSSFVTSHAAFGYLASRYHLKQIAINGISPDEEPSSQKLASIATLVKSNHIPYIFFESLVSPKFSDTIASETGAGTLVLDPIEGIPEERIKSGADYFSIQYQNLHYLQKALICQ